MILIDANVVLRYILDDNKGQSKIAREYLEDKNILLKIEVVAEVVYVLQKVYDESNENISSIMKNIISFPNIAIDHKNVLLYAFDLLADRKFDFIDCILAAFNKCDKIPVFTFDKKLKKYLD